MIKTSDEASMAFPNNFKPYWDQHFVNGEYVIAYKLNPGLDQRVESALPEVYSKYKTQELFILHFN